LPYEYELGKQIKESETFEISFKDAAKVRFKLTLALWKDWEKGDDFLYYLRPDGKEIEVFSSNDHIASDAFSFILEVPFFKYTEGNVWQRMATIFGCDYESKVYSNKFNKYNYKYTSPRTSRDASAGCRPDGIGRVRKKETAQEKKVIQFKVES